MLNNFQANSIIRNFTKEIEGSTPRKWVCEINVGNKIVLEVGSIVKHKTDKKYKTIFIGSESLGESSVTDNFNKAISLIMPKFVEVTGSHDYEICLALADCPLSFKGMPIELVKVNGSIAVDSPVFFNFLDKPGGSSVTQEVFARNFLIGNIVIK